MRTLHESGCCPNRQWCDFTGAKAAVTDPDAEGIEYIDEKVDGENNNIDKESEDEDEEDSDKESDEDRSALHINRVSLTRGPRDNDRTRLRVCLEITHPALKLPVYRTWTGETLQTTCCLGCRGSKSKQEVLRPICLLEVSFKCS